MSLEFWRELALTYLHPKQRGCVRHYVITVALMLLSLLIRMAIAPVDAGLQYVAFFPPVTLAAIIGGYRAGLLAILMGLAFASFILTKPYYSISLEVLQTSFWSNLVFLVDGIIVIFSIEAMHRYRDQYLEELKQSNDAMESMRIAAVTFDTHDGIMITDGEGNIRRVNNAFQAITGYTPDEVIGKNPRIFSSGHHDKAFYAEMWGHLLAQGAWSGEIWDRRKNGEIYPKWMTITALKDTQGTTTGYVAIFSDMTARKQAEDEIRHLAFYDPLTKLPNRRLLMDRFQQALFLSERSKQFGAVLFLDMDRFKTLNDTLGHDCGDLMLIEVAERIKFCVRAVDTVARIGGDEFVVLVEELGTASEQALQAVVLIAEKVRAALNKTYHIKEHTYYSSVCIGVYLYYGNAVSVGDALKRADIALYHAKNSGQNTVRFFDPAIQSSVQERSILEVDLRSAVPGRQFLLHYQIQMGEEGCPIGAEALIRWKHPRRGMVSPAQFIPIAEESSLILDIGHWVLDTACQQLAAWGNSHLTSHLLLAINVSAHQFRMPDFVELIEAAIRTYAIEPSRLELELTESVILNDVDGVVDKMSALKAIGVMLSLDDFGTGYSSLSYLKRLPIDQIKIDQSFVRDIVTDTNDEAMVQAIIGMAKSFHLKVIAEGVETEAQFAFLKKNGCMAFQGYLFGKPVPIEQFEEQFRLFDS